MLRPRARSASRRASRRARSRQPAQRRWSRPHRRLSGSTRAGRRRGRRRTRRRRRRRAGRPPGRPRRRAGPRGSPARRRRPRRSGRAAARRMSSPVSVSSAPVGSSARISRRSPTIARAIATRCCWPPDISSGNRSASSPIPTSSSAARADPAGGPGALAVELARQRDVLGRGQRRDQVEVLEDVADRRTPHPRAALVAERGEVGALDATPCRRSAGPARRPGSAGSTCRSPTGPSPRPARRRGPRTRRARRACTSVAPSPWTRVTCVEVQHGGHRATPLGRSRRARAAAAADGAGSGRCSAARRSRASQWSSHRISASAREDQRVEHQAPGHVGAASARWPRPGRRA